MKLHIAVCLFALIGLSLARPETYSDKYDQVNIHEIFENKRLLKGYVDCLLDLGPCTADGAELKSNLKEALSTDCEKCTDVQKENSKESLKHFINEETEYWKQVSSKYDPEGVKTAELEKQYRV